MFAGGGTSRCLQLTIVWSYRRTNPFRAQWLGLSWIFERLDAKQWLNEWANCAP
jgi:hypothetical protein